MSGQRKPMTMVSILDSCAGAKRQDFPPGTILLTEGETSGRLYVLAEGTVEVLRGDKQVALIKGAGSIFGEMSVLLNRPHTATVLTATPVGAFVFDDAESFLKSHPEIAFFLGRLLAERLNAATTYLVDIKRQFEGHGSHLGMVGEVLETLIHQQHEEFTSGPEAEADPRL
jgi:CRP/FNR family transcriptional regulator, cyclic AMP receptor protein